MIKRVIYFFLGIVLLLTFSTAFTYATSLEDCEKDSIPNDKLAECIDIFSKKVTDLGGQKKTLSSQIAQFNSQIQVTQLKISDAEATVVKLEKEIVALGNKIGYVNESVDKLEGLLKRRIVATYQQSFISDLELILTSSDFSDLILRIQYLKQVQENDKKILTNLQETKANYANQKDEREVKQAQIEESKKKLESLKVSLDGQKAEKQSFLKATQNDESKYQQLLVRTRNEFESIQAIVAGQGVETEAGHVSAGQKIATVIQGESCNSFGTHLHFTVRKPGGITDNPLNYLKGGISNQNKSGGDSFNPSGNWEWPLNPTIEFHQGYGQTVAIRSGIVWYSFHNGIDISGSNLDVKAVKDGTLYRGTYAGNGGCKLRYVRVVHDNSDLDTLYLHINYLL